jgi:hypothetical protein
MFCILNFDTVSSEDYKIRHEREKQGHFSKVCVTKNTNENGGPFAAAVLNTCRKKDRP